MPWDIHGSRREAEARTRTEVLENAKTWKDHTGEIKVSVCHVVSKQVDDVNLSTTHDGSMGRTVDDGRCTYMNGGFLWEM